MRWLVVVAVLLVTLAARADEKKDAPLKLTPADMKAIKQKDGPTEEEAKNKWDGKAGEFHSLRFSFHQVQTSGPYAGQTMFNLDVGEPGTGKRSGNLFVVYLKDERDIGTLLNLGFFNTRVLHFRGTLRVDYKKPFRIWMEDARLVRASGEWEKEEKEIEEGRKALRTMEKTKDGDAFVLTPAAQKGMKRVDKKNRELARGWDGKTVELSSLAWSYHQDQTEGRYAGQTMFNLIVGEPGTGKQPDRSVIAVVYLKDARDSGTIKNLPHFNKRVLRVRGKMVVQAEPVFRDFIEDAALMREPGEWEKEEKQIEAGRKAIRTMEKTKDGEAFVLTAAARKAMARDDKKNRELAKAWDGKTVEVACAFVNGWLEMKEGAHKGQMSIGFAIAETPPAWADTVYINAYVKDERDVSTLLNRKRYEKPFTVRATMRVDYSTGAHPWIEDVRLIRAPGELEMEGKEIEAGRKALREPAKTADGKALILGVPALKGMQRNDRKNRELTKSWDGKTVEITVMRVTSSQTHTTGVYKGQTSYGLVADEPGMVEREDQTGIGAYFTDEKDIAEVKALWSARDKKFKVRGKFEVDDKTGWWLRIADARLVKD